MKYLAHTLQHAENFVNNYKGKIALSVALKAHYKAYPKMGSKDRKRFTAVVMAYFRVAGKQKLPFEKTVLWGLAMNDRVDASLTDAALEQLGLSGESFTEIQKRLGEELGWNKENYFPAYTSLSEQLDLNAFIFAHFQQPDVFIRAYQNRVEEVEEEIKANGWEYNRINDVCFSFSINHPFNTLKSFETGGFEVQDIASIQTGDWWQPNAGESWFDCCAGSGGKSLLLLDQESDLKLSVNDNRPEVLDELQFRFQLAGFPMPKMMQADLSEGIYEGLGPFDGIIADLPCTGSGTWGRSPERLRFFQENDIERFADLQRNIINQVSKVLQQNGRLYYITCSVYKEENELNIAKICETNSLKCNKMVYHSAHELRGDTLFVAELDRS